MIISVASGKGGTGKTLVSTSLALSLNSGVQILDCDVEEPNAHIFIKPNLTKEEKVAIKVPGIDRNKCTYCGKCAEVCAFNAIAVIKNTILIFSELCHGCGACSYLCPEHALFEEDREIGTVQLGTSNGIEFVSGKLNPGEAMSPPIIRKVKEYINPRKTAILDVPPGTSCPVVESVKDSDFCLLVTEPTPFGLNDLELAVGVTQKLKIPCGVIINRAGSGNETINNYCHSQNIPILLTIPLDIDIARLYSKGITLVAGIPEWSKYFVELFRNIKKSLNNINI